jgi:hypothetical protein
VDVGVFASLVGDNQNVAKVALAIEAAVTTSFVQDETRSGAIIVARSTRITQAETKRRVQICVRIFRVLRGDMKWSWQRAVDHLPIYLRNELDGEDWEPSARSSWTQPAHIE